MVHNWIQVTLKYVQYLYVPQQLWLCYLEVRMTKIQHDKLKQNLNFMILSMSNEQLEESYWCSHNSKPKKS